MTTVERVKAECKKRKIPLSKLERDCGFANGYISGLKRGVVPYERLSVIAYYLKLSEDYLMTGKDDLPQDILDQNEAEMERLHRAAFRPEMELLIDTVKDAPDDVLIRLRYYAEGLIAGRKDN